MYLKYYIIFFSSSILYALQAYTKLQNISTPIFISSYFSDLLALPLILSVSLFLLRKLKRLPYLYLTNGMLAFTLLYTSILFEWILPQFNTKYTADFFDVIFYVLGTVIFYFIQKQLKKDEYTSKINV